MYVKFIIVSLQNCRSDIAKVPVSGIYHKWPWTMCLHSAEQQSIDVGAQTWPESRHPSICIEELGLRWTQ